MMRILIAVLAAMVSLSATADEGMWTFNNVPREDINQKYGFNVTDDWLRKVQQARSLPVSLRMAVPLTPPMVEQP